MQTSSSSHICKNFLKLLENENRGKCVQAVFQSIIKRQRSVGIRVKLQNKVGEDFETDPKSLDLLMEAFDASEELLEHPIVAITLPSVSDGWSDGWPELNSVIKFVERNQVKSFKIERAQCERRDVNKNVINILRVSKTWSIEELRIYDEQIHYTDDNVNKGIKLKELKGEHLNHLHIDSAECRRDLHVELLSSLLSHINYWQIGSIELTFHASEETWSILKDVSPQGKVGTLQASKQGLQNANLGHLKKIWDSTDTQWKISSPSGKDKVYQISKGFEKLPTKQREIGQREQLEELRNRLNNSWWRMICCLAPHCCLPCLPPVRPPTQDEFDASCLGDIHVHSKCLPWLPCAYPTCSALFMNEKSE